MDDLKIKLISLIIILTLVVIILMWALIILDNRYRVFVDEYMKRIRSHYKYADEMVKYCLRTIITQSVREENYEMVKSAKDLLDKIISNEDNVNTKA